MMRPISFFVSGKPQPAGSKRAFVIRCTGRAIVTDANPKSRDWKIDVQHAARAEAEAMEGNVLTGPLRLTLAFSLLRPKNHYRTGKNAHLLRDDAPSSPTGKPDVLKLARGVEDALTGMLYRDDAQIVVEHLSKQYADTQGCAIELTEYLP